MLVNPFSPPSMRYMSEPSITTSVSMAMRKTEIFFLLALHRLDYVHALVHVLEELEGAEYAQHP